MDQAIKTMLLAQASAEVTKRMESFMDFDSTKVEGVAFMRMAADTLGLSASEGEKAYHNGFVEFKQLLLAWAQGCAQVEMFKAVLEAEEEQAAHTQRLTDLRKHHAKTLQMLNDRHRSAVPEDADDEFVRLINSSHEAMVQSVERFNSDLMSIVQMKHRLVLEHCFTGHLVSENTAKKLTDLYEIM
ncbi:MAG TPA: hypothetical protein VN665_01805 [Candidatus Paceibacterota bacterium]|nr:hypothetical protein [Candidatus Paceibacterota bacterium]